MITALPADLDALSTLEVEGLLEETYASLAHVRERLDVVDAETVRAALQHREGALEDDYQALAFRLERCAVPGCPTYLDVVYEVGDRCPVCILADAD